MNTPLVSVWMITYNQAPYIAEAIESVLMQKTTFPVELVIGEDGSRDSTRSIIMEYCTRNPGRIRLLPDEGNLGMMRNMVRTLKACRSKYVAMCEGDDYWTDERKLQKQFDFMEGHPDCAFCFHAIAHRFPDGTKDFIQQNFKEDTWLGLKDVVMRGGSFIPTPGVFFRGEYIDTLPSWLINAVVGDYPLTILLAMNGRVRFLSDMMAAYRREATGSWSSGWSWWRHKSLIFGNNRMFMAINRETKGRHIWLIALVLIKINWELFKAMIFALLRPAYRYVRRAGGRKGSPAQVVVKNG